MVAPFWLSDPLLTNRSYLGPHLMWSSGTSTSHAAARQVWPCSASSWKFGSHAVILFSFSVVQIGSADSDRVMRDRHESRFETALVTRGKVHVSLLVVRGDRTPTPQTGMKLQSPQCCHGLRASKRWAASVRNSLRVVLALDVAD